MMFPQKALKKLRSIWRPSSRHSLGSLYDFVAEEAERVRELREGKTDIVESLSALDPPNYAYTAHSMVVTGVSECILASDDFLYLTKECQRCLYSCMSTWVGRPETASARAKTVAAEGLTISGSVKSSLLPVLLHLQNTDPKSLHQVVQCQLAHLYDDISELYHKLDRLTVLAQDEVSDITPMMIKYSAKNYPSVTTVQEAVGRTRVRSSSSICESGRLYDQSCVYTERSASILALTPLSVLSAPSIHPHLFSRTIRRICRFLTCSPPKKTEVLRAPTATGSEAIPCCNEDYPVSSLALPIGDIYSKIQAEPGVNFLSAVHDLDADSSVCVMHSEMQEILEEQGIRVLTNEKSSSVLNTTGENNGAFDDSKDDEGTPQPPPQELQPQRNRENRNTKAKRVVELTKEDIHLENTHDFSVLHQMSDLACVESSTCEISPELSIVSTSPMPDTNEFSLFPEDPSSHAIHVLDDLKSLVSRTLKLVRGVESKVYALPQEKLRSDVNECMEFHDIVRIIKEKATLLESIEDLEIYFEEEVMVSAALMKVFSDGLKTVDLFKKFTQMVRADNKLVGEMLQEFQIEGSREIHSPEEMEQEAMLDLPRRYNNLPQQFQGVKSSNCDLALRSSIPATESRSYNS